MCVITAEKNIVKLRTAAQGTDPIKGGTAADAERELWARRIEEAPCDGCKERPMAADRREEGNPLLKYKVIKDIVDGTSQYSLKIALAFFSKPTVHPLFVAPNAATELITLV